MNLREYIRAKRVEEQLSQRQLADRLLVTTTAVSEWETGKRPVPRRRLLGLAQHLVADAAYLRELWDADADERDARALAARRCA